MAGDRRRASHSIDVPQTIPLQNSRKRRPSCSQDERDSCHLGGAMDECNAALVLMSLSCSPHSPHTAAWNRNLGSSPGSSNASWSSSGSSSPPLSDDFGIPPIISDSNSARIRTASTSDEGIVMDYSDEAPRKRRAHGPRFRCTWKGCNHDEYTVARIELHVRSAHLGPKKPRQSFDDDAGTFSDSDHEEEFYYTEIEDEENGPTPPSPPTLSHRDMARPPHEDPEFQKKIVGNFRQGLLALSQNSNGSTKHSPNINAGPINIPHSPVGHPKYSWSQQSPASPMKHQRHSPRPSTSSAPYPSPTYIHQHHYNSPGSHHQSIQHTHLHQQHPQSVPTITSNSVHSSPTSASSSVSSLSHSAPAASPLSLAGHTPTMHLAAHHQPHLHNVQPQPHHHQKIHQPPHHHQQQPQQQAATSSGQHHQQSPKGRTRGENKKCRKVYGMDHKDQWCTQCKWKKACSRFGD